MSIVYYNLGRVMVRGGETCRMGVRGGEVSTVEREGVGEKGTGVW